MPSKQAMEAAQNIANVEGWEQDANLKEIAEIIDEAFAPVVSLLRECREIHRLTRRMEHTQDDGEYVKVVEAIKAIHAKIDSLIGKDEEGS